MKLYSLLGFATLLSYVSGSKILCLEPMPSRSHSSLIRTVCDALAKDNHQITSVTPFPRDKKIKNIEQIDVSSLERQMKENSDFDVFDFRKLPSFLMLVIMNKLGPAVADDFLGHPAVVDIIKSDRQYDLIVSEIFWDEAVIAGFSSRFKAPLVVISTFLPGLWANEMVGNPAPYSYIPDSFLPIDTKMTFLQRVQNTVFGLFHEVGYKLVYLSKHDAIMRKHFGDEPAPIRDILKNVSLVLVNHHYSLAYPRPYVPNMVEVAGMHISEPKLLPPDVQKYMDEAKNGVIYFSLGSNAESSKMPQDRLDVILSAFSRLDFKIIWKWETDNMPNKPDNVMIGKWFPQSDILAHPNLKLFITHGGLLSTTEAVHRGVPIVGIPIFAEQPLNMKLAEQKGFGLVQDFDTMTADSLQETILEVLTNPKYLENAKRASTLLKDNPMTPMQTVLYWVNYVLRHKGAKHMRSAAQDLSWIELQLIDVISAVTGALLIVALILYLIYKFICYLVGCRGRKRAKLEAESVRGEKSEAERPEKLASPKNVPSKSTPARRRKHN